MVVVSSPVIPVHFSDSSHTMGLLYDSVLQHYARKQGSWHTNDMYNMYGVCCDVHLTSNDYDPRAMSYNIQDVVSYILMGLYKCNVNPIHILFTGPLCGESTGHQ